MTKFYRCILLFLSIGLVSCNSTVKTEDKKETIIKSELNSAYKLSEIWKTLPLKNLPLIDSTNFESIKDVKEFNNEQIKSLQISVIYPKLYEEGNSYKIKPAYKINLSKEFYTVAAYIFKGEQELETILINYNSSNENLIDFKTITYDEIAEGWSRKYSKINNNVITIIDEFYGDNKQIDTTKFHINRFGEINQIRTKFSSKLRPNKFVLLNQVYTDTIEFKSYNDNGDYFNLIGNKNGIDLSLIYNWEAQNHNQYDFKYGDLIKVKWKMDSIWIAGDGETLDFSERAIDADKVKNGNVSNFREIYKKPIKYYQLEGSDFTNNSLDKLYLLVEYYLANSKDELVQINLKENASLIYSIEQRERKGKEYIVLGISNDFQTHTSIIKWLYYENGENDKLYEYDLVEDKLIPFD